MPLNLLQIVQRLSPRLGFRAPTVAIASQDLNVQIITSYVIEEGEQLARRHDWNVLTVEYTVTATATTMQSAFPTDFDRFIERAEIWNRSRTMPYQGPTDEQHWQQMQSGLSSPGTIGWWRIYAGRLHLLPVPAATDLIAFNYVSTDWASNAGGTPQNTFLLDSDLPRLPDNLFVLGARWRYRQSRGLDYAEDMSTYERYSEIAMSHDRGLGLIRKSSGRSGNSNTWPGTITVV